MLTGTPASGPWGAKDRKVPLSAPPSKIRGAHQRRSGKKAGNTAGAAVSRAAADAAAPTSAPSGAVSALTLFPRGSDQVIPQVLAVFLFYLSLVFPVGTTREGLLLGR